MSDKPSLDQLVSLAKRRGFIYPGSELYGGLSGTYDYGPLGLALKNNIRDLWWKMYVDDRSDMYGLESSVLMNSSVWQASGHTEVFTDPMVEDKKTGVKYRADHLLEDQGVGGTESMTFDQMDQAIKDRGLKSPAGNELSSVKSFNMMFQTQVGASSTPESVTFLRPETAQGMFVNFKNILDSFYPDLPFGLAQVGRCFRNEISPREFLFRVREFEIMELEYFVREDQWSPQFEHWRNQFYRWVELIGLDKDKVFELEVPPEDRAHYSKRTVDFEYKFSFGTKEIGAVAYRTDFDLKNHMKHSGQDLRYTDKQTGQRFIPHVIEPTFGLDRHLLAVLSESFSIDNSTEEPRMFLALKPSVAPVRVAVFPLLKNKPELVDKAKFIFDTLKPVFGRVWFDAHGNIGKRYRRQDEIGTPQTITVDFDTIEDGTVTVRDRDTTKQDRVAITDLVDFLRQ